MKAPVTQSSKKLYKKDYEVTIIQCISQHALVKKNILPYRSPLMLLILAGIFFEKKDNIQ
jgi:hypothetical protein